MLVFPEINPILLQLGPITIYWYGVLYLLGFVGGIGLCKWRVQHNHNNHDIYDICFYMALGIIFGGRVGMVFYNSELLWQDPLSLLQFWLPGRSFHGGLLGVILALYLYSKKHRCEFWQVTDFIAPVVPFAIICGRMGNFINGELWGRVTSVPWAMVFPHVDALGRHPSQLYELFLEGIVLFIVLWHYSAEKRRLGQISGLFILLYGIFRVIIEFFREPDLGVGFILGNNITMGQLLSVPMILLGIWLYIRKESKICNNI
ncbi:MAG: prolipoprotein diacylglyceryl transferase [Legionellales bacterium]|nr:MAG: prolipoprotein diacylglyceryl transferase [Legionellales bacterium]